MTEKASLVSVIVPVYNVKPYLKRCVDSILQQTYQNLEIILVDDGSTDGSEEIVDKYRQIDKRIIVIHQTNGGLSVARNTGLRVAAGKYVTFVDSDDHIAPDMIEYLLQSDADVTICAHFEECEDGKTVNFNTGSPEQKMTPEVALREMLLENGFMVSAWGKLYLKKLFDGISFPEGKLFEDVGTTYKIIMKAKKIVFLPEPKYYYLQRSSSISKSKFNKQKLDLIQLTDRMCSDIVKRYPTLKAVTSARRLRARLSIIKQLTGIKMRGSKIFNRKK